MALEQRLKTIAAGLVLSAAAMLGGCKTTEPNMSLEERRRRSFELRGQVYQPPSQSYVDRPPVTTTGPDGRPMLSNEANARQYGGVPASPMYDREGNYNGGRVHIDK